MLLSESFGMHDHSGEVSAGQLGFFRLRGEARCNEEFVARKSVSCFCMNYPTSAVGVLFCLQDFGVEPNPWREAMLLSILFQVVLDLPPRNRLKSRQCLCDHCQIAELVQASWTVRDKSWIISSPTPYSTDGGVIVENGQVSGGIHLEIGLRGR